MGADSEQLPATYSLASADGTLALPSGTLTAASTDEAIIALWLRRPNLSKHSVRSCRKEAERFIFWLGSHGKGLRDVRIEDLLSYSAFLTNPQPAAAWVSAERRPRADPRWRPFCGPLTESSQRQALMILSGLFRWARAAEYLSSNPADLLGTIKVGSRGQVSRFLPEVAITLLLDSSNEVLTGRPGEVLRRARNRFAVMAFYLTATRLSELVGANMSSIRRDHKGLWWLHVVGKGNKAGQVPVPPELVNELIAYRQAFGLSALPSPREPTALLLTTRGPQRRASHWTIAESIEAVMKVAAERARDMSLYDVADRIEQASTHWLRHSSLTHQVDAGVPLKTVQNNARHSSLTTTGRYVHKEDEQRHAETVHVLRVPTRPSS